MYYIYILRCADNSLYTGITTDIERRLKEHTLQTSKAAAYTKAHPVTDLEALWKATDRSSASKLEYKIKKLSKDQKEQLILNPSALIDFEVVAFEKDYFEKLKKLWNKG